ncbi:hypothetical protein [Heyndrickxia acidiproducens]|uniref:hypothetical protein n=1 Tax=Heyndrickxia acidiproducens TaxID=1121084 RepID=UPI000362DC08|nr:hypothetical protein [Heyndrickxia acidiproducens]
MVLSAEEHVIFIIELGRLLEDYRKCRDERIKLCIYEDILLIGRAIHQPMTCAASNPLNTHPQSPEKR